MVSACFAPEDGGVIAFRTEDWYFAAEIAPWFQILAQSTLAVGQRASQPLEDFSPTALG
jgi:hypothetical protein